MQHQLKALIIGQSFDLCLALPKLFYRAGFIVDMIHTEKWFKYEKRVKKFSLAADKEQLIEKALFAIRSIKYDAILIGDDQTIKALKESSLSDEIKTELLPVIDKSKFLHLASKIGLSKVFYEAGIKTPEYRVASNESELVNAINDLGFPLIIKADFSGGGHKTFDCLNEVDSFNLRLHFTDYPAIVQRKIYGDLISIDAFYQNSYLVHFSYARVMANIGEKEFTPSVLREYTQTKFVEKSIFNELVNIGIALGAHGFSNLSAIYSPIDRRYYFFEADMRPTVWADFSKYFGDCLAQKIRNYFDGNQLQQSSGYFDSKYEIKPIIPFPGRMNFLDILFNKSNAWKFIPVNYVLFRIYLRKLKHILLSILNLRFLRNHLKALLNRKLSFSSSIK